MANSRRASLYQHSQVRTLHKSLYYNNNDDDVTSDDYSDDALSAHESELDKMKGFYEDHKDIFKLIDKREEMWSKMLQFEVCCYSDFVSCNAFIEDMEFA